MNQKKARRLRQHIIKNLEEVLILIRNEFGDKTDKMDARQIYQHSKRLYYEGKIKV